MKSHFSLISSQLLPKSQSLTLDCDFVFLIWQLIHSVQIIHSEMTFGCQAAAQGAPASTAKVFLRLNLQSLRWIASLFLIKPSLTCSIAPSLQNANILLVCILVFLPTLENSRTPCFFVHFTKGRVSVFLCPENNYLDSPTTRLSQRFLNASLRRKPQKVSAIRPFRTTIRIFIPSKSTWISPPRSPH